MAQIMRGIKRSLKYAAIASVIIFLLLCGGAFYMLDYALKPEGLITRSRDISGSYTTLYKEYPEIETWADSLQSIGALCNHYIENRKGERLHALFVRAAIPTRKTAVIVHGYTDNAVRMLPIGYMYCRQLGYNILLTDLHAHGQSYGEAIQMGWLDRFDVMQWIDCAEELFGDSIEVVVHGISMGAATTMMLSGEAVPSSVKCFVEDCGYTSVWDEFRCELKNRFGLPAFPLLHLSSAFCKWKYGWDFREASAREQVKKCMLPMLFIHGDSDTFVPTWMVYPLYDAKPQPKELWIVPDAGHAKSYKENKAEYTRRVECFIDKYMQRTNLKSVS